MFPCLTSVDIVIVGKSISEKKEGGGFFVGYAPVAPL